ncbi:MAG: toprim domain-containing protein [Sulfurimonas sp.]|nr:toprim domain-containing protein [Sulfurimonas sp.]
MKKFTDQEIKNFISRTNEELAVQDPREVLVDLGIEFKEIGNDSYRMNLRNENTPSAFISLKDGMWKYTDFGDRTRGGNIVNVVMDVSSKKNYKDALNYSLNKLGIKNYLDEALSHKSQSYELTQADKERIKAQREANRDKERSNPISKVTAVYEVSTNDLAVEFLKARGVVKVPNFIKIINGEYTNSKGEIRKAFGVGVLTQSGSADIHFLHKVGDLKSISLGEKDLSFYKNPNSNKVAIFEGKWDAAACNQQMPLDDVNVIIANSASNSLKVAELLKKENLTKNVMIFNQNDLAGYKFVVDIAKNAQLDEFKSIGYNVMSEYKKDPNDLLLEGEKIADRIETRPLKYFEEIANSLEAIQKMQQSKPISITKEDIQTANKNIAQDKEIERS